MVEPPHRGRARSSLGGLLNFIAIAANGGVMPADPDIAVKVAGAEGFVNSRRDRRPEAAVPRRRLRDAVVVPLHNVYSVGDAVIVLGVLILLHVVCGTRLVPRRWRAPAPAGA